nr:atherin-like [Aegilops tauschii subsp. strangulata]
MPVPPAAKSSGFVLQKRPRHYAAADAGGEEEERAAAPSGTQQPATAAPPLARKGGNIPRASPAQSSSRGPEDRPQEKAISTAKPAPEALALSSPAEVPQAQEPPTSSSAATNSQILATTLPPPPPISPLACDPSASPNALEEALSALTQLRDDLQGADLRLVVGHLELISGWFHFDVSVRAALGQAAAASEEDKRAAGHASAALEAALKDAAAAKERSRVAKVELEKRDRLEKLEKKVEAERDQLEAKATVLVEDHVAFGSLDERSREALQELYEKGLEEPLVTDDEGLAQLLHQLVAALEDVINGIGSMVDGKRARSPHRP